MRKEFKNGDFGPIIPMGASEFGKAPKFPKPNVHPRLLFTEDMIPAIKRSLSDERFTVAKDSLLKKASTEYDGILGIPTYHDTGRRGLHNYDAAGLDIIQAKAFMYAIEGDKELAYQAIDAMENYLLTLNIRFIYCDQCRDFGKVMLTAAKVYDWCYDVLTDDEKQRLIAGTINYTAIGTCSLLQSDDPVFRNYGGRNKMEMGYPPRAQGSVTGHGSEGQLIVHYMSGAIAFYDEFPDWWEYCAARYFNDFVPTRNAFYASGSIPQGISYGPTRQHSDLWAAFAHKVLFGKNPHDDTMLDTVRECWQLELPNESFWNDGDNFHKDMTTIATTTLSDNSLLAAALYRDTGLLAQRVWKFPSILTENNGTPDSFIFVSEILDLVPSENRHEGYSPVDYIPLYLNRMIARHRWDDPASPAVYMKAGHRSTANHEHKDIGTFQIFYKDLLVRDSGIYDSYGSPYSTGTVGHNGVTVFNPAKADSINGWYSGSQRAIGEAVDLDTWLSKKKYHVANPEGASYSVKDGKTEYAYVASDISPAYDEDVEYLSRRMLSIFTDSEDFPMIFACYDRITAANPSFRKAILLHAEFEPKLEGNRVTLTNGGGKLVAEYLSAGEFDIEALGGEDRNRMINGKQCGVSKFRGDGWRALWGRVEVVPRGENLTDSVLSVMCVTDADNENAPKITKLTGFGILGAVVMNNALVFIEKITSPYKEYEIETEGEGDMTYYVSGLSEGKWRVKVGRKSLTLKISADERFARFTAPRGKLTLTKC